jgi:alkaline phosphatase D
VGTSVTSDPPPELISSALPENPHIRYFESHYHYRRYVAVELTRDRTEALFRFISDHRDPHATVSILKRFVVENGKPGAVPG